jgi:hypothetical protein
MNINNMVDVSIDLIFKFNIYCHYDILQLWDKQNKQKKTIQQQTVHKGLIAKY